ncbi:MAG: hypothetical protein AB7N76_30710 [Planctomycetota bacterium]
MSEPGFRFFPTDAAAIAVALGACAALWGPLGSYALAFPVVLGHFFLFCNVFRVRRSYELCWSLGFVLIAGGWLWSGRGGWLEVLACQTPLTALAIGLELRSPRYRGVGWRRINPGLETAGLSEGLPEAAAQG